MSTSADIVIVGAGPAGLAAACAARVSGLRVLVLDDTPWIGGQIWRGELPGRPKHPQAKSWFARFKESGASLLSGTSVIAAPRPGVLLAERRDGPEEIHWQQLVIATGARELFLPFPGWTLPGVIGPGGLQALVKNGFPVQGKRIVIAGSGLLLLAVADGLKQHGARVVSINEQAPLSRVLGFGAAVLPHPAKLWQGAGIKLRLLTTPHRFGVWPVRTEGNSQVRSVTLTDGHRTWTEDCDLLACGFGLVPNTEFPALLGCDIQDGFVRVNEWQNTSLPGVFCAGELTGIGGSDAALVDGMIAGYAAGGLRPDAERLFHQRHSWQTFRRSMASAFALRSELKSLAADSTILCRCEDVSLGQLKQFTGWRDAKLQSRCGMGPCQGRICGGAVPFVLGWKPESIRPPVLPARVGSLITESHFNPAPSPGHPVTQTATTTETAQSTTT